MTKYINPYTDFGFKKLFGEEANKDLLIDFLNTLLPKKHRVKTLEFRNPEHLGTSASDRRTVFDVFCDAENGEKFIVEMQKEDQEFFKDRTVFYSTHLIQDQGQKGRWNYELKAVYFIGILDFIYDKDNADKVLIRRVSLKDQFGKEFYRKLRYIYLQMPVFKKEESQLKTQRDKWLYFLKHLPDLDQIPSILNEEVVFQKAFHTAEVAAMSKKDRDRYRDEQKQYWDYWSTLETAEKNAQAKGLAKGRVEGRTEGRVEGRVEGETQKAIEIARNMKNEGFDSAMIIKITGLSPKEIEPLD